MAVAGEPREVELPGDMFGVLFSMLDFRAMGALACTCRVARAALHRERRLEFGRVRLSPMQASIREQVQAMPNPSARERHLFTVGAPWGFGKTITGYSIAFPPLASRVGAKAAAKQDERYAIFVPPKAYATWVGEHTKVFGHAPSEVFPATQVLFAHSSVDGHLRYAKKALEAAGPAGPVALGAGIRAIVVSIAGGVGFDLAGRWATRLIIDEAHAITNKALANLPSVRWQAFLSANAIAFKAAPGIVHWGSIAVSAQYMVGSVPEVELHYAVVEPRPKGDDGFDESRAYTHSSQRIDAITDNLEAYLEALARIFAGLAVGQVALYLPDGEAGDAIAAAADRFAPGWEATAFVTAMSKIRQFEARARSLLLVRHNKTEAINILASHLVIVRPDWVNSVRYAQLIGRVLRPMNTNKKAGVHVVAPRGIPTLRAQYYEALRRLMTKDLELEVPALRAPELEKADAALRLCGSRLATARPAEVVAAVGIGFDRPATAATVLDHWAAEASPTLTRPQMQALLGLAEPAPPAIDDGFIDEILGL